LNGVDHLADARVKVLKKLRQLGSLTGTQSLRNLRENVCISKSWSGSEHFRVQIEIRLAFGRGTPNVLIRGFWLLKATGDLLSGSEQEHASAEKDYVAEAQNAQLAILAIDPRPIGAFEVRQNKMLIVILNFAVVTTDPFIVQLDRVTFFTPDRDRWPKVGKDTPSISPLNDA
jgi:hypothetical protein